MPPFEKGHKKVGGRKKGTPNRFNSNLQEICVSEGVDPFRGLLKIAKDRSTETGHRIQALKEVCEYVYPKRRRVEFDADQIDRVMSEVKALQSLSTEELTKIAEDEIRKAREGNNDETD